MNKMIAALVAALLCAPAIAKNDMGDHGAKKLSPGMEKKVSRGGQLPPGWEKRLQKGKPLASDLYSRAQPVTDTMRVKLPVGPTGSVEIRLEGKIVRLHKATHEILDVFDIR